jgi:hypothetical protein
MYTEILIKKKFKSIKDANSKNIIKGLALAGNRTRAARVAGEHSTTEPPMLDNKFCVEKSHCNESKSEY